MIHERTHDRRRVYYDYPMKEWYFHAVFLIDIDHFAVGGIQAPYFARGTLYQRSY